MTNKVIDFGVIAARTITITGTQEEGLHHTFTTEDGTIYKSHWGLTGIKKQMERDGWLIFHIRDNNNVH